MASVITVQELILRSCRHAHRTSEVNMSAEEKLFVCCDCWNRGVAARRQSRKAQLAHRALDCMRCAAKPSTRQLAGVLLCGRCCSAVKAEHYVNLAKAGQLAIFATHLLVNTDNWKGLPKKQAEVRQ